MFDNFSIDKWSYAYFAEMFDSFSVGDWSYEHRVLIYFVVTGLASYFLLKDNESSVREAQELREEHIDELDIEDELSIKHEREYLKLELLARIDENLRGLSFVILWVAGLFAVHFIV